MKKQPSLLQSFALAAFLFVAQSLQSQNVFSFETNTTGWQSQTSGGAWSSVIAGNPSTGFLPFVQSKGFSSATNSNFIWGSTISGGTKAGYTSAAQDSFVNRSATFAKFRKQFSLPDSICKMDSARISLICDDGIDSVWVNNSLVLTTPILYYGINYVTATIPVNILNSTNNEIVIRAVDYVQNRALYAKFNLYYKTQGNCCTAILRSDSMDIETDTLSQWQSKSSAGIWANCTLGSTSPGFTTLVNNKGFTHANTSNFIWGSTYSLGYKPNYNSSSQTTYDSTYASFVLFRNQFTLPDSVCNIDSARVWLFCDDGIDSVWMNNHFVFNTPIIYYGINAVTTSISGSQFNSSNNEITIRTLDYGAYYGLYAKLRVYYKKGNCCVPTAIHETNASMHDAFSVYPIPTKGYLVIEANVINKADLTCELVNTIGQVVLANIPLSSETKTTINTESLQNGIYFLRFMKNNKVVNVQKVVVEY